MSTDSKIIAALQATDAQLNYTCEDLQRWAARAIDSNRSTWTSDTDRAIEKIIALSAKMQVLVQSRETLYALLEESKC